MCPYLGVEPWIGFSNAFRMIMAVTKVNKLQIITNRIQTFLADSNKGIDHIPTNVQTYKVMTQNSLYNGRRAVGVDENRAKYQLRNTQAR